MKRIFTFICAFTLVLSIFVISTAKVSAAPTQQFKSEKATSCNWYLAAESEIYDQATHTDIGTVEEWTNGCGYTQGECISYNVLEGTGAVNHCYEYQANTNGPGAGSGTDYYGIGSVIMPAGEGSVGWVVQACGVSQFLSQGWWGKACTSFVNPF